MKGFIVVTRLDPFEAQTVETKVIYPRRDVLRIEGLRNPSDLPGVPEKTQSLLFLRFNTLDPIFVRESWHDIFNGKVFPDQVRVTEEKP